MNERRAIGALEDEIMSYLWVVDSPSTPAEVHASVAPELAYTTIMTVLTRLWQKGLLDRERTGRAFAYRPTRSEADHRAEEMQATLADAANRDAVLSSFVDALDTNDLSVLKKLLSRRSRPS